MSSHQDTHDALSSLMREEGRHDGAIMSCELQSSHHGRLEGRGEIASVNGRSLMWRYVARSATEVEDGDTAVAGSVGRVGYCVVKEGASWKKYADMTVFEGLQADNAMHGELDDGKSPFLPHPADLFKLYMVTVNARTAVEVTVDMLLESI